MPVMLVEVVVVVVVVVAVVVAAVVAGAASGIVKTEPGEEMMVQVDSLRFTQASCAARFRGGPYAGRTLEDAVQDLISGRLKHHQESWFMLDAVKQNTQHCCRSTIGATIV